jgi:hypothetical protein
VKIDPRLTQKKWRINHLYKIVNKQGKLITFTENEVQADYNSKAHRRNINLKSRQRGFTTNALIDGLDDVLFNRNFNFTLIAHTKNDAKKIFQKAKIAWEHFPLKSLYTLTAETQEELHFAHGSTIRITTSARSDTVQRLHISEFGKICAKYPEKAREIITGSIPAVPTSGRIDIESTAEGEIGDFYEMCQEAMYREPKNDLEFKFHFYGWTDDNDCVLEGDYTEIPQELRDYQAKYSLNDSQIYWYFVQRKVLKDKMTQEYPTTPDEAFASSGLKLFPIDIILKKLDNEVFTGRTSGDWIYYKDYRQGHHYGLGCDVAEGIGRDSSTIIILDFTTSEVVAVYKSSAISPDLLAFEIRNGAERYGNPIVGVERNNHGYATLVKLKEIYPTSHIFKETNIDRVLDTKGVRLGWHTNLSSKPRMLFELKSAIEDDLVKIYDRALLIEMKVYDKNELNVIKADEDTTNHFDLLMALAIAYEMRKHIITKTANFQDSIMKQNEEEYTPTPFK